MKYKVLLVGNNHSIINDFFLQLNEYFECQNSSSRFDDIACHLKYFRPHVFIYCMSNEPRDLMLQMVAIKKEKFTAGCRFIVLATQDDCDEFRRLSVGTADMDLVRPISTSQIRSKLIRYLEQKNIADEPETTEKSTAAPAPAEPISMKPSIPSALPVEDHRDLYDKLDPTLSPPPAASVAPAAPVAPATPVPSAATPRRKHILVIDDDFRMLKLIKRYLDDTYDIATAISGKVARKFLKNKTTDLILLDYEMPDENGAAVLEKLRQDPITHTTPVIFLTGINESKKIRQVLSLKPQGYLLKPIERDKLIEAIEKTIG